MIETNNNADIILVRGLPGAGETTEANKLNRPVCVAADDWFMVDGEYKFDPKGLPDAHGWCLDQATQGLQAGLPVVVHNTFTQRWEMEPYIQLAERAGARLVVMSVFDGGLTDEELAERTNHDVPANAPDAKDDIARMRGRFEHDWRK